MENIYKMGMIGLVVVIVIAFFLPWVSVESAIVGGFSQILTGKKQATIDSISGFDVPVLANSEESRFMISVIEIFNPGIQHADKKSYLIWLVPGLAVIFFILSKVLERNKWFYLAVGILGVLIFAAVTFKILTTDLDKLVLKVNIGFGLWILLVSYLGIGGLNVVQFVRTLKK